MIRGAVVVVILLSLALPASQMLGQGRSVKVMLHNGSMIEGELLCVQDSSVLVAAETEVVRQDSPESTVGVKRIPNRQIAVVTVEGSSHVLLGMGLGLLAGALAGGAIGASQTEEPKNPGEALFKPLEVTTNAVAGAMVGGLGGLALGGIIGGAASQSEHEVVQNSPGGMASLSQFAKYPGGEPAFLRAVP